MSQMLPQPDTIPLPGVVSMFNTYLDGRVILPTDPDYDRARMAWNLTVEQHPAVIVVAKSASDIVAAVNYARHHQLGVAVQATGHGNVRPADDCLLILTHELTGVEVDPLTRTARVQAGAKWGVVLAAAQTHGLAPLLGSSPEVGAVGYTLGGGMGWLGRKYGLSTDNVLQFEIVTADGQVRIASASENPELFWGLRGGGGSLGAVTAMTIRLFPVTEVYAGNLYYPVSMAGDVFRHFRSWIENAPDELTTSFLIMHFPPMPELPEMVRGQSFAIVRGCYCGSIAEGEAALQHWRQWQQPLIDDFKTIPFSQAHVISNDPVDPLPSMQTGAWLRDLSDPVIDAIVHYAGGPNRLPTLIFAEVRHAGGAVQRVPEGMSVYGNRNAEFLLWLIGLAPTTDVHHQMVAYLDQLKTVLRPYLTGGVYMSALEGVESQQRIRNGLVSGGYERLARLKALVDPENLFGYAFNVSPAG